MEVKADKLLCCNQNDLLVDSRVKCPCNCGGILKGDGRSRHRTSLQCNKCNCYYVVDDLEKNIRIVTKYTRSSSNLSLKTLLNKTYSLLAGVGITVIPYSPMWLLLRKAAEINAKPRLNDSKHLEYLARELAYIIKEAESIVKSLLPEIDIPFNKENHEKPRPD